MTSERTPQPGSRLVEELLSATLAEMASVELGDHGIDDKVDPGDYASGLPTIREFARALLAAASRHGLLIVSRDDAGIGAQ